jgi:formate hydrogenlyase subunit 6/NADH:ubiquinone oxidoreductase subunit I
MTNVNNKWPFYEYEQNWKNWIFKTTYMNRISELVIDTSKCKACAQCAKACPTNALEMPIIPKGTKVDLKERMPLMPVQSKCVFCGVCMTLCPFDAIYMKIDGKDHAVNDLKLKQGGILPEITKVKMRKVDLVDETFANPFWDKLMEKISSK